MKNGTYRTIIMLAIVAALYAVAQYVGLPDYDFDGTEAESYAFPFLFGLIASVHCIAVCGWINLAQCKSKTVVIKKISDDPKDKNVESNRFSSIYPSLLYSAGRLTSYTIAGVVFGFLGSMFTMSGDGRTISVVTIIIGLLMFVMGINLLGIFPQLRRFAPKMHKTFVRNTKTPARKRITSYIVGFFNWLMPCGPLQAAHLLAFSTGSAFMGGLSMFLFALGTIPLTFALGMFGTVAGKDWRRIVITIGGIMVAVLGLCLLTHGFSIFFTN